MLEFSEAFKTHIQSETTTLCWGWRVTRRDGFVLGFTDHDETLTIEGLSFNPRSGFTGSQLDSKLGFSTDNAAIDGILSTDAISADDIDTGRYEGAQIELLRICWTNPETHALIWSGNFGAISKQGDAYTIELKGQSARLERSTGRVFASLCDARFGDARCGLNLVDFPEGTTCNRSYETCKVQFSNSQNFRGFPFIIGNDAMQSGPEGQLQVDGGSRY